MKIPPHLQIFDLPVVLTYRDQDRLGPHLSNWNKLNDVLLLGVCEADLRRLVLMELMGRRRRVILNRLLPAILRAERGRIEYNISEIG